MTAMTPSIRQVPKLIFHDVDPWTPPCPLNNNYYNIMNTVSHCHSGYRTVLSYYSLVNEPQQIE